MKRTLASLACGLLCVIASFAATMPQTTAFYGEGITVVLFSNGTCLINSPETGRITGTYEMTRDINPGEAFVNVTFTTSLDTFHGQLAWPIENGLMLNFENVMLSKVR